MQENDLPCFVGWVLWFKFASWIHFLGVWLRLKNGWIQSEAVYTSPICIGYHGYFQKQQMRQKSIAQPNMKPKLILCGRESAKNGWRFLQKMPNKVADSLTRSWNRNHWLVKIFWSDMLPPRVTIYSIYAAYSTLYNDFLTEKSISKTLYDNVSSQSSTRYAPNPECF